MTRGERGDDDRCAYVLGLDVGTQSLRAALVDRTGRTTVAYRRRADRDALPAARPGPSRTRAVVGGGARGRRPGTSRGQVSAEQIVGIGLDCTACTVVACDDGGPAPAPALLWMDQRSHREADEISATGDPVLRYVSGRVSPEWMLPKALWLKRNEPEIYRDAARIVECTDWMMHRLTGEWTLSLNHVAVKWNYARPDGGWPLGLAQGGGARRPAGQVARDRSSRLGEGTRPSSAGGRRAGPPRRDAGGAGGDRRLPRDARHGGDGRRRRRGDRGVEHLPPGAVEGGGLRLGRGGLLSRRDRRRACTRSRPARPPRARSSTGIAATSPRASRPRPTAAA